MGEVMPKIWEGCGNTHKGRDYNLRSGMFEVTHKGRDYTPRSVRIEGIHKERLYSRV